MDTDHKGVMGGLSFGSADRFGGGVAIGTSESDFDLKHRASQADVRSTFLGLHGVYRGGGFTAQLGGAYEWQDVATDRTIGFQGLTETASANYDANTTQLFAEVGYKIPGAPANIEPFARLEHFKIGTEGFDEAGQTAALSVAENDRNVQFLTLGARASGSFPISASAVLEPKASLAWRHGWGDLTGISVHSFANGDEAFPVIGSRLAKDSAELDLGLNIRSGNFRIGASYRGNLADSWDGHGGQVTLGFAF